MVLLLRKLYLYFTEDPEGDQCPLFSRGGGCPTFSRGGGGPNANFYRNPYTYLLISRRGCPDPLFPSGSAHGQCLHNGTIFITVPLLAIIARH